MCSSKRSPKRRFGQETRPKCRALGKILIHDQTLDLGKGPVENVLSFPNLILVWTKKIRTGGDDLRCSERISTAPRKNRSILKSQNYRIWDEIGSPPHRAKHKSRAIIWFLHQKRVHTDLFWPEYESKINVMVSFQPMLRLKFTATIGVRSHSDCRCAFLRSLS
jgi:hypothetical protein